MLLEGRADDYPMFHAWKKRNGRSYFYYRQVIIQEIMSDPNYRGRVDDGQTLAVALDNKRGKRSLQKLAMDLAAAKDSTI